MSRSESQTRKELIDPLLKETGWGKIFNQNNKKKIITNSTYIYEEYSTDHETYSSIYFFSKDQSYSYRNEYRPKLEINYNLPVGNDTIIGGGSIFGALFALGFYAVIIIVSFVALSKYRERRRYKSSSLYIRPIEKNAIQNNSSVNYCIYCGNALSGQPYCIKCGKRNN